MTIMLISLYSFDSLVIRSLCNSLKSKGNYVVPLFFKYLCPNRIRAPTQKEMRLLIEKIKQIRPEIVGISVRSPYIKIADMLSGIIKKNLKSIVIYGGIHPALMLEESLKCADMVCVGEGEESFPLLVERIEKGGRIDNIKGIGIKKNGKIIKNGYAVVNTLESISFVYFAENKFYRENNKISRKMEEVLGIKDRFAVLSDAFVKSYSTMVMRGCPSFYK